MAKKKRKAKRRGVRGLGCGPGPVSSGPCLYDRPLAGLGRGRSFGRGVASPLRISLRGGGLRGGLRGTVPEHREAAESALSTARDHLDMARTSSDCETRLQHTVLAHDRSAQALAEARWLPGSTQRVTRRADKREHSAIWDQAYAVNTEAAQILRQIGRAGCKVR